MFTEKFLEVLNHEGVVSIVTFDEEPHIVNTWNSFIVTKSDDTIFIPAAGMRKTEKNLNINNEVQISLGSKNVEGFKNYPGTGFIIKGTTEFLESGEEFEMMKDKFPFITRALKVNVTSLKQKI